MDGKKVYQIQINGISESISAVESLNKQLLALENRINALEKSNVKLNTNSGGSSKSSLSEEEKLAKQIEQIDAKRKAYSKEIYQNYLAAKDVLNETVKDQKQIAAQERLQANNYSNTMSGLKQELADLKTVMQTTDLADEEFSKMSQRAGELTAKLKELEQAYGQFGRDVGNYDRIGQGLDKLKISVGDTVREFSSAREASRTLKNELTALEIEGKSNTEQAKQLRKAYNQLTSAIDDATKSSKAMDEAMDWMTSFTAMASVGSGLKAFFGFDENEITRSIQKLVSLQNVLKGIESIRKQMDTGEGIGSILSKGSEGVDKFVASITGAQLGVNGLVKGSRLATVAVRSLSIAMKGLGIGLIIAAITGLMQVVEKAGSAIQDYFKGNAELADASHVTKSTIDAENNALKQQRDIITTKYMKGYIDDIEYARQNMVLLTDAILDNIDAMQRQINEFSGFADKMTAFTQTAFVGFGDGIKVKSDFLDMTTVIKNIDGAKSAWKDFSKAVQKDQDIISANGARTFTELLGSFIVTADDAKDDFVQIGQIIAGEWVRNIQDVNVATDEGKKKLKELVDELNNDEVTNSVMMNLDKYFPDEALVKRIQNVINHAQEMQKAFEFEAETQESGGADYWRQVRIDAKTGAEKVREQIKFDKEKEIRDLEKYGRISDEHRQQIEQKYRRKELEQLKQFGKERQDAQNDLKNLEIQAMKEGLAKELAQLEQEKKEKIQKVKQSGILVGDRITAINNLYRKKELDAQKKWAADILKTYEDLYQNIQQLNRATFNMEGDNASMNVENRAQENKQAVGYSMISPSTYDNSKSLEEYYRKVFEIEKKASERQAQINQERLDKELEYNKQEEDLRHNRLVSENGDYKQQLEAGKITQEQYDKLMEDEKNAHISRMNALDKEYAAESKRVTIESLQEQQRLYNEYYSKIVSTVKDDKTKIDKILSQATVNKGGWGLNIKETMKEIKAVIAQYEGLKNDIKQKQRELEADLKQGRISAEDFAFRQSDLKNTLDSIDDAIADATEAQMNVIDMFVSRINTYVQVVGQTLQGIMSAIWDYQDYQFEKEQDELEKYNEELDKKLDEQQEIVEKHKNAIDSIEDELATARGDRRQHLIDQLNAEIEAQRMAQAEEKRIQKEKEAAEKKQEELEKKRREEEYKRNVTQAFISWHLGVANALATQPFMPVGLAMGALATALGAVQYALVKSQKPYAKGGQLDGGVAQGKRHSEGGIPVLGGRASIEGGEFITNRATTAKNVDLLEYINSKKKRVDIDDLIEFYGTTPKKTIRSIKTRFADGGYLPTLPNQLDIKDQLQNIVVNQDNRPIYVSVVDINNKQDDVRRVQALAGLS